MPSAAARLLACLAAWLLVCGPAIVLSAPAVAVLLLTPWDGRSTVFGNAKWGRGSDHYAHATGGYWAEFNWLVLRNPVNNLLSLTLGAPMRPYTVAGDPGVGDKQRGGCYRVTMGPFFEYYLVAPYSLFGRRCLRVRFGWKLLGCETPKAPFVFAANPWKPYSGS